MLIRLEQLNSNTSFDASLPADYAGSLRMLEEVCERKTSTSRTIEEAFGLHLEGMQVTSQVNERKNHDSAKGRLTDIKKLLAFTTAIQRSCRVAVDTLSPAVIDAAYYYGWKALPFEIYHKIVALLLTVVHEKSFAIEGSDTRSSSTSPKDFPLRKLLNLRLVSREFNYILKGAPAVWGTYNDSDSYVPMAVRLAHATSQLSVVLAIPQHVTFAYEHAAAITRLIIDPDSVWDLGDGVQCDFPCLKDLSVDLTENSNGLFLIRGWRMPQLKVLEVAVPQGTKIQIAKNSLLFGIVDLIIEIDIQCAEDVETFYSLISTPLNLRRLEVRTRIQASAGLKTVAVTPNPGHQPQPSLIRLPHLEFLLLDLNFFSMCMNQDNRNYCKKAVAVVEALGGRIVAPELQHLSLAYSDRFFGPTNITRSQSPIRYLDPLNVFPYLMGPTLVGRGFEKLTLHFVRGSRAPDMHANMFLFKILACNQRPSFKRMKLHSPVKDFPYLETFLAPLRRLDELHFEDCNNMNVAQLVWSLLEDLELGVSKSIRFQIDGVDLITTNFLCNHHMFHRTREGTTPRATVISVLDSVDSSCVPCIQI